MRNHLKKLSIEDERPSDIMRELPSEHKRYEAEQNDRQMETENLDEALKRKKRKASPFLKASPAKKKKTMTKEQDRVTERVLHEELFANEMHYLVKWVGIYDPTWEQEAEVEPAALETWSKMKAFLEREQLSQNISKKIGDNSELDNMSIMDFNLEHMQQRIEQKQWFDDEMIHLLFDLIRKKENVVVWNSQCYTQRVGAVNSYNQAALCSLIEEKKEMVLAPYNTGNHWILLILNLKERKCSIVDSYAAIKEIPEKIKQWIQSYNNKKWQVFPMLDKARQSSNDGNNCGSYVVTYASLLAAGKSIEEANAIIDEPGFSIEHTAAELRQKLSTLISDANIKIQEGMNCLSFHYHVLTH